MSSKGVVGSAGKNLQIDTQDISVIDAPLTREAGLNTMRSNVCDFFSSTYICVYSYPPK